MAVWGGGYTVNTLPETPVNLEYTVTQEANKSEGKTVYLSVGGSASSFGIEDEEYRGALLNIASKILTNKGYQVSTKKPNFQERESGYLFVRVSAVIDYKRTVEKQKSVGESCRQAAPQLQSCKALNIIEGIYDGRVRASIGYKDLVGNVDLDSIDFSFNEKASFNEVIQKQYTKKVGDSLASDIVALSSMFSKKEGGTLDNNAQKVKGELFNVLYQKLGAELEERIDQGQINGFESSIKNIRAKKTY